MKPFNLEAALRGEPVITRNGEDILEIHYFEKAIQDTPIVAVHADGRMLVHQIDGRIKKFIVEDESDYETFLDLFMKQQKKKLYIVVKNKKHDGYEWHRTSNAYTDRKIAEHHLLDESQIVEIEIEV